MEGEEYFQSNEILLIKILLLDALFLKQPFFSHICYYKKHIPLVYEWQLLVF